jgi:hypothetical protein
MINPDKDSEYQRELKKLIDQKIVSEKTAQIHLSQLRNLPQSEIKPSSKARNVKKAKKNESGPGKIILGMVVIGAIFVYAFFLK